MTAEDILWRLMVDAEFALQKDGVRYPALTHERRQDIRDVLGIEVWKEQGHTRAEIEAIALKDKIQTDAGVAYRALPAETRKILQKQAEVDRKTQADLKIAGRTHKLTAEALERLRDFVGNGTDLGGQFKEAHTARLRRGLEASGPSVSTINFGTRSMIFTYPDYEPI